MLPAASPRGRLGTSSTWMRMMALPSGARDGSSVVGTSMEMAGSAGSQPFIACVTCSAVWASERARCGCPVCAIRGSDQRGASESASWICTQPRP